MEDMRVLLALKRSIKESLMISIFSNGYQPEKCSVGFVEKLSNEQVLVKHVTQEGLYDGFIIRKLKDIFRIDIDGQYERRLALLYNIQNQSHLDYFEQIVKKNSNLFKIALEVSKKRNLFVRISIDETEAQEDIIGLVKEVNKKEAVISKISLDGLNDGECFFFIDDIVKMNCDSVEEKALELLYKANKI